MKKFFTGVAVLALAVGAMAQSEPRYEQREENQQKRIGQGVSSGSLTAGEAARLERKETVLDKQADKAAANGLTAREKARIAHRQNELSRGIAYQKHDRQVQGRANGPINAREREQQERIGQGISSGSLTSREAARVETKEARMNRQENRMRASGGKFTPAERRAVWQKENHLSRQIYRQKHDRQRVH